MAGQNILEQLWPELQRQILLHIDSLASLHDLIHASPRLYHVFRANKEYILSNFACQHFHHAAIHDALAVQELRLLEEPPFSRESLLKFFEQYHHPRSQLPVAVLPLSVSINLCRLDTTVRFFIDDFSRNTLPILAQLRDSTDFPVLTHYTISEKDSHPDLSDPEVNRLRRALCRFELYRQLFARCSSDRDHSDYSNRPCLDKPSLTIFEQGQMFFQSMPAYQVAEIACLRDYLCRRLRGIFDAVEDDIVEILQAGMPHPESKEQAMDWVWENAGHYFSFLDEDDELLGHLGRPYQSVHIEHLLSLGLPYIQKILRAVGHERERLLVRRKSLCRAQYERKFLTAALGLDIFSQTEAYGWNTRDQNSCLNSLSPSEIPPGWLWAHPDGYYSGLVEHAWKGLRDWGYVFWDLERLQEAEILGQNPRNINKVYFSEFHAGRKPSIEERWIGAPHYSDPSETGEIESFEDEEGEEGHEEERPEEGQEEIVTGGDEDLESPETARKPSSFPSKMRKSLRHAIGPILKLANTLKRCTRRYIARIAAWFRSSLLSEIWPVLYYRVCTLLHDK